MEDLETNQVLELLRAMDRLRRAWKSTNPGDALNKSQFFTLMTLQNKRAERFAGQPTTDVDPFAPMTLSELAKTMRQTMPAISQRIRQLEKLGYVSRKQDQNDRRTVWIQLTESGYEVLQQTCCSMFHRLERILKTVNKDGQQNARQLIDSLNRLADAARREFESEKAD